MTLRLPTNLRTRLTFWYVSVLAVLLVIYATLVFAFQYVVLTRQIFHDEVQDVVTVEGLFYFDAQGSLQLRQDYYSRPQSHLLIDRMMEVRDLAGNVLYRSPTLQGMPLGGPNRVGEGDAGFDERIVGLDNGSHVFLISHIHAMNGRTLLIRLGYDLAPLRARLVQFVLLLLIAIPLALALAAIAGQVIAKRALRPLELMANRAEGITASNLSDRLVIANPNDELGQMGRVFNHLLDRLEQAFIQLQRFTADAAHELRTPIAALRAIGEVALEGGQRPEQYKEALASILEETASLSETIDSLLLLARAEATQPNDQRTSFKLTDLMNEILNLLEVVIEERQISVIQQGEAVGAVSVHADRSLLRLALMNVMHNALKFSPSESTLRISYTLTGESSETIHVAFQDQGPGIDVNERSRVFERFYTSKSRETAASSGTGLGLSIAKLIIDRSGGKIWFDEGLKQGAGCNVELLIARR